MIFYLDEAGVGLLPSVGRAYAPRGKAPVIAHKCRYKHPCVISAVSDTGKMLWDLRPDAFKGASIVQFLKNLVAAVAKKILVIWDGASIHRGEEVKLFLSSLQDGRCGLSESHPTRQN